MKSQDSVRVTWVRYTTARVIRGRQSGPYRPLSHRMSWCGIRHPRAISVRLCAPTVEHLLPASPLHVGLELRRPLRRVGHLLALELRHLQKFFLFFSRGG
jgi:hypothetical protein